YPFDPNLAKQGIPVDDRVDFQERIFAPLEGTPMPPGAVRAGTPPIPPPPSWGSRPPAPVRAPYIPPPPPGNSINGTPIPPVPPPPSAVPAVPSAFHGNGAGGGPSVASAPYNPQTGQYLTPDGQLHEMTNLAAGGTPKSWQDLLPN
nr:mammalian cell entry protein [Actinomycetes bacterium]